MEIPSFVRCSFVCCTTSLGPKHVSDHNYGSLFVSIIISRTIINDVFSLQGANEVSSDNSAGGDGNDADGKEGGKEGGKGGGREDDGGGIMSCLCCRALKRIPAAAATTMTTAKGGWARTMALKICTA